MKVVKTYQVADIQCIRSAEFNVLSLKMYRPANLRKDPNDRFIPLRIPVNFNTDNSHSLTSAPFELNGETLFFNLAKKRYNDNNYQNLLRETLLPVDTKVLNFFPPKQFTPHKFASTEETWPVKPRKKPVIEAPNVILDMPHFDTSICHHVADWSSTDGLATIFHNEIHMWYPDSDVRRVSTNTEKRVKNCVKWNNDGTQFAVGLFPNKVGVYDIFKEKMVCETRCCLLYCDIYSLEWIKDVLITGCSKGVLTMHTNRLKCLKKVRYAHVSGIISIVKSCNNSYIATSGLDKCVVVWKMPQFEEYFHVNSPTVVKALAWHPWKNFLLATAISGDYSRVTIWNVNTQKLVAQEKNIYKNSSIDCLTFNPISAELVVSYYTICEENPRKAITTISVFSNINKIVEELYIHRGAVPYLLWGSGGKLLASISADENLCVWNFFGLSEDKKRPPKKIKRSKEEKSFLCTITIR